MTNLRTGATLVLVPFAILTGAAVILDAPNGFVEAVTLNLHAVQIWVDVVIAMVFWCAWVVRDSRDQGNNPWGWVIAALLIGAFAPLLYMIIYQRWPATRIAYAEPTQGSSPHRVLGAVVLVAFSALTVAGVVIDGTDIPGTISNSWSNLQIWVDLVIVVFLWIPWMFQDARNHGQNPWGWLIFAVLLGSFAPLIYLCVYGRWPASHRLSEQSSVSE